MGLKDSAAGLNWVFFGLMAAEKKTPNTTQTN
jgi:hypothetical protein